ncbi:hypothetical protein HMI55_003512 [Coelomomyces lativittatus]|nr:hypothetical protein HMI55_003512 [Coelomomyces lativittatus]
MVLLGTSQQIKLALRKLTHFLTYHQSFLSLPTLIFNTTLWKESIQPHLMKHCQVYLQELPFKLEPKNQITSIPNEENPPSFHVQITALQPMHLNQAKQWIYQWWHTLQNEPWYALIGVSTSSSSASSFMDTPFSLLPLGQPCPFTSLLHGFTTYKLETVHQVQEKSTLDPSLCAFTSTSETQPSSCVLKQSSNFPIPKPSILDEQETVVSSLDRHATFLYHAVSQLPTSLTSTWTLTLETQLGWSHVLILTSRPNFLTRSPFRGLPWETCLTPSQTTSWFQTTPTRVLFQPYAFDSSHDPTGTPAPTTLPLKSFQWMFSIHPPSLHPQPTLDMSSSNSGSSWKPVFIVDVDLTHQTESGTHRLLSFLLFFFCLSFSSPSFPKHK